MSNFGARTCRLRSRQGHIHHRVAFVELFFDLVFVFAVTQLSHGLLAHLDAGGAVQTAFLMLAMWWVWITASWMTNWLDPERHMVRLLLFAMMLAGLVTVVFHTAGLRRKSDCIRVCLRADAGGADALHDLEPAPPSQASAH